MKKEVVTQSGKVLSYEETFWLGNSSCRWSRIN